MKREELRVLLNELVDMSHDIPFDNEVANKALRILCTPGVAAELRTLIWQADKDETKRT